MTCTAYELRCNLMPLTNVCEMLTEMSDRGFRTLCFLLLVIICLELILIALKFWPIHHLHDEELRQRYSPLHFK